MIDKDETQITGGHIVEFGVVTIDDSARRIQALISLYLMKICNEDWVTLYQDPVDKRYWELNYPQGHLQGGGPPSLTMLPPEEAKDKYSF